VDAQCDKLVIELTWPTSPKAPACPDFRHHSPWASM